MRSKQIAQEDSALGSWPFGEENVPNNQIMPFDYDIDPERFRAGIEAVKKYTLQSDIHEDVARRFVEEHLAPVLDLGCGEGRFTFPARQMGIATIALDLSATMLASIPEPRVQGDARRLPFPGNTFGGIVALYMLYHLLDPSEAVAEIHRVLRPGGLFVACAPSRYNDPELSVVLGPQPPMTFDAENGPEIVARSFKIVQVDRWDTPCLHLPDHEALHLYLRSRHLCPADMERALNQVTTPITLTKRGALIYGRKGSGE
jgi:SAM-dependent methyltransferase